MSGKYLLDTNIVIALFGRDPAVLDRLKRATEVFVPVTVLGELFYGACTSAHVDENVARIDEFASSNAVLDCNSETAQHYGRIKSGLRAKGKPIPENDVWIAAVAMQFGLTVASRDNHFNEIDDLPTERW